MNGAEVVLTRVTREDGQPISGQQMNAIREFLRWVRVVRDTDNPTAVLIIGACGYTAARVRQAIGGPQLQAEVVEGSEAEDVYARVVR